METGPELSNAHNQRPEPAPSTWPCARAGWTVNTPTAPRTRLLADGSGAGGFRKGGGSAKVQIRGWSSLVSLHLSSGLPGLPARSPGKEHLEGPMCLARLVLPSQEEARHGPWALGPPHSLSQQLRGVKGLPRLLGPGCWRPDLTLGHRGQRGQRAAREPAAEHCGTGQAGPPQASWVAALGAHMLGCRPPHDAQERGAPSPARSGPEAAALPARRDPVARRLELPAALRAVAGRHLRRPSGNRARAARRHTTPAPGVTDKGVGAGVRWLNTAGERINPETRS